MLAENGGRKFDAPCESVSFRRTKLAMRAAVCGALHDPEAMPGAGFPMSAEANPAAVGKARPGWRFHRHRVPGLFRFCVRLSDRIEIED